MAKLPNYYKVSVDGLTVKLDPIYEEMAEVVRCKDCKHFDPEKALSPGGIWCGYWGTAPAPDDFCSYGERRDG